MGGIYDISNADRLGKSEVQLVNIFIEGVAQIIRWEQSLEKGENIDSGIQAYIAKFSGVSKAADYPPAGLSESVRKLPAWIQAGCGEKVWFNKNEIKPKLHFMNLTRRFSIVSYKLVPTGAKLALLGL